MIIVEFERTRKIDTHLNIAPLIDVVFLLLIFFMLSSQFITQPGIKITLPAAATAKLHPEEDVAIFITEDNRLYLNNEEVTLDSLAGKLRIKMKSTGKKNVIIKADEKIDLGLAVKVMDIARQAEAAGLIISTKLKQDVK